jgi:hypothetical protein
MCSLQSDAARVLYFEKSLLIGGSNDDPLSEEERLEVRKQFFVFLKNDLRSLSFSGLRWWKLLHIPQCLPIIYQQKLLKIINERGVIEEGDLTLYFILVVVRKILKTVDTNETLWDIVISLLRMSVSNKMLHKEELEKFMGKLIVNKLVKQLDTYLVVESGHEKRTNASRELLIRIFKEYKVLGKDITWGDLVHYIPNAEKMTVTSQNYAAGTTGARIPVLNLETESYDYIPVEDLQNSEPLLLQRPRPVSLKKIK